MTPSISHKTWLTIGFIGAIANIYAYFTPNPDQYYLISDILLVLTAIKFNLLFFIALEIVHIMGNLSFVLGLNEQLQATLPIFLVFQLVIYYGLSHKLTNFWLCIGLTGLLFRSMQFSINNSMLEVLASSFIAIYAYKQVPSSNGVTFFWAIPNSINPIIIAIKYFLTFNKA